MILCHDNSLRTLGRRNLFHWEKMCSTTQIPEDLRCHNDISRHLEARVKSIRGKAYIPN